MTLFENVFCNCNNPSAAD